MKAKTCKTCNFCKKIYRRFFYRFWKEKIDYCIQKSMLTEDNFSCSFWTEKTKEIELSPQRFANAEEDLLTIYKTIKENSHK